jgi:plasmid stabilization system protein ParE
MTHEFSVEAKLDLFSAQDRYEHEREGLGMEFLAEIERTAAAIGAMPQRFPQLTGSEARRALGKRFPYMLVFFVLEGRARIVAVLHQHQDPETWKSRR